MEMEKVTIEVLDCGRFFNKTKIIGSCSVDLSSIYLNYEHEHYRVWMMLEDPLDEREGC